MTSKDERTEQAVPSTRTTRQVQAAQTLRQRAEEMFKEKTVQLPGDLVLTWPQEIRHKLHELQVYQVELELQNDELRRAQEELESIRSRYFELYNLAPVGYCTLSEKGLILEANLTAAVILGVELGVLVTQPISRFIHKEDQDIYYAHRKKLFETGSPQVFDLRMVSKGDVAFWAQLRTIVASDADGTPVYRLVLSDITEQKHTEATLKASEERYRELVQNANSAIFRFKNDGTIAFCNEFAQSFFGYCADEMVGRNVSMLLPQKDRKGPDLPDSFCDAVAHPECSQNTENENVCRNGRRVWMNWTNKAILDRNGRVVEILSVGNDITVRKHMEAALRAGQIKLEAALASMAEAVCISDADGQFIDFNDAFVTFHRFKNNNECSRDLTRYPGLFEMFTPNGEPVPPKMWAIPRALRGETAKNVEYTFRRKDTGETWVGSYSFAPIRDKSGAIIGSVVTGRDVTERKQAESYREMGREVLQILNNPGMLTDSIHQVVDVLQNGTGLDAVGIRLQDGEDFPYVAQRGFPQEFVQRENTIIARNLEGSICQDEDGNFRLECTCGLVISGQTDPGNSLFTPGGSFWTNDSSVLLDIPANEDLRFQPRNHCIHYDYASIALIPILDHKKIVGLLQLNNQRKDSFSLNLIEILETIASHIGAALMRKQAEGALRVSETKYRALFENMINGFALHQIVADESGKPIDYIFREVNHAFEKLTGLKSADILNKTVTHVLPGIEKDPAGWIDLFGEVALTGKELCFEQYSEQLGRWYAVMAYRPMQDFFATVFEDITEWKQSAVVESRLAAIVASAEVAILSKDLNGIIQTWNVGAENVFGYKAHEVIGKNISLLVPPGHTDEIPEILERISHGQIVENFESVRMRKDGVIIPISLTISAIRDANGKMIAASLIAHDITKRQQAEHLQTLNQELELRVEQRTRELQETQKQYLHAEKLSAIGKLSASIAHEFNNPLQGILTILKGLRKRAKLGAEDTVLLDAAIGESDRIKELIRGLQEFNRPSSGRKVPMDVHKALDSMLLLHKSDFKGKRIVVECHYAEQLPPILAVPDQIKQVFLNLLTNAADACRLPGGVITVGTRQEGNRVAITISDTGIGIKPEEMDLIFQPFYTTKPEIKGTGLGLSVSHGIVESHGGEIRVESRPGEGATFTVLLPINSTVRAVSAIDK
ncbi:PAS domain S-box protein [uncultured Desulfobulbus sp.]|uniref:PAS domain S-box protein n=1 Tax=uncultured Desulfobulbus sp. TaxID=239745 RepID=UPI0029C60CD2|nr:PAS domain S-box protein [uncultured Desulfobulbus sp.]